MLVSGFPEPADDNEWQPATSRPGELFTYEGQIRSVGAFAKGMVNHDPRLRAYRRSMWRAGLAVLLLGVIAVVVVAIAGWLVPQLPRWS